MSFITSTIDKVLAIAVAALLVLCVAFGGLWWYRGTVIEAQNKTIASQKLAIENFQKDRKAQDVADSQLKADKELIAKERDAIRDKLKNALKDNKCANTAIPDDAGRMLDELYSSQRP